MTKTTLKEQYPIIRIFYYIHMNILFNGGWGRNYIQEDFTSLLQVKMKTPTLLFWLLKCFGQIWSLDLYIFQGLLYM